MVKKFYIVRENPTKKVYEIVDEESTLSAAKNLAYEYETSDFRHHSREHYYVATIDDSGNTKGYLPLYATKQDTPPFNKNWKIVESFGNNPVNKVKLFVTENMSRSQLIDAIEDKYNSSEYNKVDKALSKVLGVAEDELDSYLDDSDSAEGFYSNLTTSQLQQVYDILTSKDSRSLNLSLNKSELYVLIDAMQNYSDPSFTKDREMSFTAKEILRRLREL